MKLRASFQKVLSEGIDEYQSQTDEKVIPLGKKIKAKGYSTKKEFQVISDWKSPRVRKHILSNPDNVIKEVTIDSLKSKSELTHIGALLLIKGVSYPVASAFLHLCHRKPYPIIDFRALWALGYDSVPQYDIQFWQEYVEFTRSLSKKHKVNMRTLDRALWGYSKKFQR